MRGQPGRGRPAAGRGVVPRRAPGEHEDDERDGQRPRRRRGSRARARSAGPGAPPRPWAGAAGAGRVTGPRADDASSRACATRRSTRPGRSIGSTVERARAGVVLELLLRGGVHVDLAGLVGGDVELDRLADRDVDRARRSGVTASPVEGDRRSSSPAAVRARRRRSCARCRSRRGGSCGEQRRSATARGQSAHGVWPFSQTDWAGPSDGRSARIPCGTSPREADTEVDAMGERLRARDLAFLDRGDRRRRRGTTRRSRSSTPATRASTTTRWSS